MSPHDSPATRHLGHVAPPGAARRLRHGLRVLTLVLSPGLALAQGLADAGDAASAPQAAASEAPGTEAKSDAHPAGLSLGSTHFGARYQLGARPLLLNGGGVRAKMIIKVYAMALYLPEAQHDAGALLASDVPHSIQVVMLRDVEARQMSEGFGKAVLDVLPPERQEAVLGRLTQLSQAFARHGDVHRGEVVKMEYQPGPGTRVSVGDQAICPDIPGADFNVALLSLWLGERAADERLKLSLLGVQP
jgi:hypothetical protein